MSRDLTLLNLIALLTRSKLPKNLLPTSFSLRYYDHLRSSAIYPHSLSDPATLTTPSGKYETQNFSREDFIELNTIVLFATFEQAFDSQCNKEDIFRYDSRLKRNATCKGNAMARPSKFLRKSSDIRNKQPFCFRAIFCPNPK